MNSKTEEIDFHRATHHLFSIVRLKKKKNKPTNTHSSRKSLPSTTHNPGLPVAFLILSPTYHYRLRISHLCSTQASSCTASHVFASNMVLCTRHITLLLGKLQQGHIHSLVHINPLCSEHSDSNSQSPSLACQQTFSNLEKSCRDGRAVAQTEAGGRGGQSNKSLLPMTLYAFAFSCALSQQVCVRFTNYTLKNIVLRRISVRPEANLAS